MRITERSPVRRIRRFGGRLAILATMSAAAFVVSPATAALANGTCDTASWIWTGSDPDLGSSHEYRPYAGPSPNGTALCTLWAPANNWGVVALQDALIKCYGQEISRDGIFGSATTTALKNAQTWENATSSAGLTVDGKYGNDSRAKLRWPRHSYGAGIDSLYKCRRIWS